MVWIVVIVMAAASSVSSQTPPLPPTPDRNMSDPYYTAYHFQPQKNWMNDPNGPFYDEKTGLYHFFCQYNPTGPTWGDMNWYHAVSKDLVHWADLPVALAPDHDYDCGGEFSGSATILPDKDQTPVLSLSVACNKWMLLAVPVDRAADPLMVNWTKSGSIPTSNATFNGPVFDKPAYSTGGFRDPTTAWLGKDGTWRMATGCGDDHLGGACLFKSKNFVNWTSVGWLHQSQETGNPKFWECPDVFPIPSTDTWVLKASAGGDWWSVGEYIEISDDAKPDVFKPSSFDIHGGPLDGLGRQQYDFGQFYASKTFYDPVKKRQILFGWVKEEGASPHPGENWSSIQSFPRVVTLDPLNSTRLMFNPIDELKSLRGAMKQFSATVQPGETVNVTGVSGTQLDLSVLMTGDFNSSDTIGGMNVFVDGGGQKGIPVTISGGGVGSPFMENFDMPGGDYYVNNSFGMGTDAHVCEALCVSESQCQAWTFVAPGTQEKQARCCLKTSRPPPVPHQGMTSGVAHSTPSTIPLGNLNNGDRSGVFFMGTATRSVTLRVLVDRSVIEAYAQDGRGVATHRVYPGADQVNLQFTNPGNSVISFALEAYELSVANPPTIDELLQADLH